MREKMGKIEQRFIPGQEEGLAPPLWSINGMHLINSCGMQRKLQWCRTMRYKEGHGMHGSMHGVQTVKNKCP